MRRPRLAISLAWLMHAAAWFLPAAEVFGFQVRGWEAFWATLGAVFSKDASSPWYVPVLAAITTLTTLLFILGSPWVVFRGSCSLCRKATWIAATAFVFNAHWWIIGNVSWSDLRIGYFLWWTSFAVLALGLFSRAEQSNAELIHSQADLFPERTS
jgi:hypothetical protein